MIARIFHNPNTITPVDEFDVATVIPKVDFRLDDDYQILEWIFRIHNAVDGNERNVKLHLRSLSVGDEVSLDGRRYVCSPVGWSGIN